jgi:hypothetical protein
MRAMVSDSTVTASLAAILAVAATAAFAAVPPPPINGVVVEDVSQSYVFDRIGFDNEIGPFIREDAYQGIVRTMVVKAPDNTFDFYFHFDTSSGPLSSFGARWQVPTSYTVAYHVTDRELLWAPAGPSGPAPGTSIIDATFAGASWREDENGGGSLFEGWLGLDTAAKAYAANATYQIRDSLDRLAGNYSGVSPTFTTFGPAIPEPETYALMLAGLGLLALGRRWRRRLRGSDMRGSAQTRSGSCRAVSHGV